MLFVFIVSFQYAKQNKNIEVGWWNAGRCGCPGRTVYIPNHLPPFMLVRLSRVLHSGELGVGIISLTTHRMLTVHCSVSLLLIPSKRTILYTINWKRNTHNTHVHTNTKTHTHNNAFAYCMVNFGILVMTVFTTFLDI